MTKPLTLRQCTAKAGRTKSPAKSEAARRNGKLGGRPKMPRCKTCSEITRNNQCSCTVIAAQRREVEG